MAAPPTPLAHLTGDEDFVARHVGPTDVELEQMLEVIGAKSLDDLLDQTVPAAIRSETPLDLPAARSEPAVIDALRRFADRNRLRTSLIGMGYTNTHTPAVIRRNLLEDPAWYTAYTPYQPEISQGRLEALLNFQTMVSELTGLPIANASLLDEATAAAEAMAMARRLARTDSARFVVHHDTHPQTIAVLATRAEPIGVELVVGDVDAVAGDCFGALFSVPTSTGAVADWSGAIEQVHAGGGVAVVATDLLACVLGVPPGQVGADIAVGSAQRFGVPMGFGGPHAAFIAAHETAARALPGRIVGVSTDTVGRPGPAARPADTGAAHPPREGDIQHLHGPGPARQHRRALRGLARTRGPHAHRRASPPADLGRRRRAAGRRPRPAPRFVVRHDHGGRDRRRRRARRREGRRARLPARRRARGGAHLRRDVDPRGGVEGARRVRCGRSRRCRRAPGRAADTTRRPVPRAGRVQPLPHRARDVALPAPARGSRSGPRPHDDPSRLLHDEAQRHHGDGADHLARVRRPPPLCAGRRVSRSPCADRPARNLARRDHRLRRRQRPAQRRQPGRVRRAAGDPRLSPVARPRPPHDLPDPVQCPRDERGERGHGRVRRRRRRHQRGRQRRPRRPTRQARHRRRPGRGDHAHLPVDARRVRGGDRRGLRCRPRRRRPGLRRRGEPQRPHRRRPPGPVRRRRQPPQPAQDVLHPPRRRRARGRADRRAEPPRPLPPRVTRWTGPTEASAPSPRPRSAPPASCRSRGRTSR